MSQYAVKIVILVVTFLTIAFNIYLALDDVHNNTISETFRSCAKFMPIIPFTYGVLGGHFFHFGLRIPWGYWTMFPAILLLGTIFQYFATAKGIMFPPLAMLLTGICCGMFLWPT